MPRANRHALPGHLWHITHRCHRRQFLLRFARDRRCWRSWLFQARKRYGLCVLDYIATSNHIHLLVLDRRHGEIPRSMQLIAGRTARQYNQRKKRAGAYWQDRYHATAVDTETHLVRALVYIDLNMVRTGVVDHPAAWEVSGYRELQNPPQRYRIVDLEALQVLAGIRDRQELQRRHAAWVDEALRAGRPAREPAWTEALAVGSTAFLEQVQTDLGLRAGNRRIDPDGEVPCLREAPGSYLDNSVGEIGPLGPEIALYAGSNLL